MGCSNDWVQKVFEIFSISAKVFDASNDIRGFATETLNGLHNTLLVCQKVESILCPKFFHDGILNFL